MITNSKTFKKKSYFSTKKNLIFFKKNFIFQKNCYFLTKEIIIYLNRYADHFNNSDYQYLYTCHNVFLLRFGRFGTGLAKVLVVEKIHNTNTVNAIHSGHALVSFCLFQTNRFTDWLYYV
jgi:hypothetical protein